MVKDNFLFSIKSLFLKIIASPEKDEFNAMWHQGELHLIYTKLDG